MVFLAENPSVTAENRVVNHTPDNAGFVAQPDRHLKG
jgi:hypothetical protein